MFYHQLNKINIVKLSFYGRRSLMLKIQKRENGEMLLGRKKCNWKSRKTNRYYYHNIFIWNTINT